MQALFCGQHAFHRRRRVFCAALKQALIAEVGFDLFNASKRRFRAKGLQRAACSFRVERQQNHPFVPRFWWVT
jgi:hypothetical protein